MAVGFKLHAQDLMIRKTHPDRTIKDRRSEIGRAKGVRVIKSEPPNDDPTVDASSSLHLIAPVHRTINDIRRAPPSSEPGRPRSPSATAEAAGARTIPLQVPLNLKLIGATRRGGRGEHRGELLTDDAVVERPGHGKWRPRRGVRFPVRNCPRKQSEDGPRTFPDRRRCSTATHGHRLTACCGIHEHRPRRRTPSFSLPSACTMADPTSIPWWFTRVL